MSKHAASRSRAPRLRVLGSLAVVLVFVGLLVGNALGLTGEPPENAVGDGARAVDPDAATPSAPASSTPDEQPVQPAGQAPPVVAGETLERVQRVLRSGRQLQKLAPRVFDMRIGTLNILGSQHTAGPGGYGPGPARAATSAGLVVDRGIDVMGMQEVQRDQQPVLDARLGGYTIWPRSDGLGRQGYRLQIAWRTERFDLLDTGYRNYPFDRQTIPMPYVLLKERTSGAEFFVINTHNSARGLEGERDAATGIQVELIREMRATGRPVFIVGDVNEHTEFFCSVATSTGLVGANGGSGSGGCSLPPGPLRVDWIMGGGEVDFSGYVQDGASRSTGASDHYFIHASARVTDTSHMPD
ncbi:endonuclease/exonuclease/phosphatase family protein [Nocardioides sp. SYSU D00038]|uniref:endonuclease/exonuclease/phosphatase family protein n=1 Tax=Nocardioides sp. SYSU D00038 TaxID=2812554 RepID=UPI001966EA6C|nr:endonuclease/exonuclease/phosphatase family protein [Nocardioides sp. SYSU D00038]